jgi:hypothetical protein
VAKEEPSIKELCSFLEMQLSLLEMAFRKAE